MQNVAAQAMRLAAAGAAGLTEYYLQNCGKQEKFLNCADPKNDSRTHRLNLLPLSIQNNISLKTTSPLRFLPDSQRSL